MLEKVKRLRSRYASGQLRQAFGASRYMPGFLFFELVKHLLRLEKFNAALLGRKAAQYKFLEADSGSLEAILACSGEGPDSPLRPAFSRFFAAGQRCFVAEHEGRIVGRVWVFRGEYVLSYDEYRSRNLLLTLDESTAFTGNGFVASAHRLKGVFPQLRKHVIDQLPSGTQFFTEVDDLNAENLKAARRLGFETAAEVRCTTVLGQTRYYARRSGPWERLPPSVSLQHLTGRSGAGAS